MVVQDTPAFYSSFTDVSQPITEDTASYVMLEGVRVEVTGTNYHCQIIILMKRLALTSDHKSRDQSLEQK